MSSRVVHLSRGYYCLLTWELAENSRRLLLNLSRVRNLEPEHETRLPSLKSFQNALLNFRFQMDLRPFYVEAGEFPELAVPGDIDSRPGQIYHRGTGAAIQK